MSKPPSTKKCRLYRRGPQKCHRSKSKLICMAQWLLLSCCFRDLSIWLKIRIPYTQSHKSATIELLSIHLISAPTACNKQRIFTSHVMQSENEWRKWCYETMFVLCWPMPARAPNIIHFLMHSKALKEDSIYGSLGIRPGLCLSRCL